MRSFHLPGRSPVFASNGMVATSHPLAASEALSVLKEGGNAADAAIAGAVLLGVCEPQMAGIGGDCFALVKPAGENAEIVALNGSGRAPQAIDPDKLRSDGLTKIDQDHPAAITVPGAVDAFCDLNERFGKLGLDSVLAPAIKYFEEGVPVAPRVATDFGAATDGLPAPAKQFYSNSGHAFRAGENLRLPDQAEVLKRISRDGRDAFYKGEVADDMLAALSAIAGVHTPQDFDSTKATWSAPVSGPYGTRQLIEHPPNGQGAVAILLAGILNEFDIASLDPNGARRLHLEAEATKLAYGARDRFLADVDHMDQLEHLLEPATAKRLAGLIDPKRSMAAPRKLTEDVHRDTVLITVVDRDGMAVSLIYSIFATFGSGIASPKFGVLFHNRGCGFNLTPGHPNELGPGKRPMHTIIPGMTSTDGKVDMTFGVMGGQYQATGHAHLLSNIMDFGMDLQEAIDAPRTFADIQTGKLQVEDGISETTCAGLMQLGHDLVRPVVGIGGAQAIAMDHARGVLTGASDPRKDGIAIGY